MLNIMKKIIVFGIVFSFVLLLGACSNGEGKTTDESASKEINVRINNDPDFLDPHKASAAITFQMILNIYDGLLFGDTDGSLKPALAEDYTISDDGLTYKFTIRDGVKFHNGDPLTMDDIMYSFERLMGKDTGKPLSSNFDNVVSLDAPDDHTFVIKLKEPNSAFLSYLTAQDAAILPRSNDGKHNEQPIGTGPFKFVSYSPQNNMVLEKNEDYWKEGLPYLDKVTFTFQPDDQTALLSLQAGEMDIVAVGAHRVPEVENDFNIMNQNSNATLLVGYNEAREPFKDVRVRQAINYAINKDAIIEAVYSGYATKLGSNMSPAMGAYYKESLENKYPHDVEKAKELLAEAGYPDGFDTTISISSHAEMYTDVAQVVVENLKEVGINAKIDVVEWGIWLEKVYQARDYDMTIIDFTGKLSPFDTIKRYRTEDSGNLVNFSNAEYDDLMEKVLLETNEERQIEMYHRAQEILAEEAAADFIADYQIIWALNPKIEGYKLYPYFFHDLSEVKLVD